MINEVKYSRYGATGCCVNELDFDTFVKSEFIKVLMNCLTRFLRFFCSLLELPPSI